MRRLALVLSLLVSPLSAAAAEIPTAGCGTFPGRRQLELAKHRFFEERRAADGLLRQRALSSIDRIGDLLLIQDDGSLVSEPNPLDLAGRSLAFRQTGGSDYRYGPSSEVLEPGLGDVFSLGDDATRSVELAFEFPFYGQRYRRVFVNSDGNLTFEEGDSQSDSRSLGRVLSGPPRIALYFTDLNPEAGGTVRVANLPDRLVVTWSGVPEYGLGNENTFQVVLASDGRIQMRFGVTIQTREGIVGLSSGRGQASVHLVDIGGEGQRTGAILERFAPTREVDHVGTSQRFFRELGDDYDALVIWTNFDSDIGDALAFAMNVRNDIRGIGEELFDDSASWGSAGELETYIFMANLRDYPSTPDQRFPGSPSTTLSVVAHEVGHRWLAYTRAQLSELPALTLLGRQNAHWSFFFHSQGSFIEGNAIEPQSETTFLTGIPDTRYSRLDLYLMGLAPASEVAPVFVVADGIADNRLGPPITKSSNPRANTTITGTRTDVLLDDIIAIHGPREPRFENAPKEFRQAWILLTRPGEPASEEDIARVEAARLAFEPFFTEKTQGRGRVSTRIGR